MKGIDCLAVMKQLTEDRKNYRYLMNKPTLTEWEMEFLMELGRKIKEEEEVLKVG